MLLRGIELTPAWLCVRARVCARVRVRVCARARACVCARACTCACAPVKGTHFLPFHTARTEPDTSIPRIRIDVRTATATCAGCVQHAACAACNMPPVLECSMRRAQSKKTPDVRLKARTADEHERESGAGARTLCVHMRACVRVCVRACVRACVCACRGGGGGPEF
jgi:hypothetical protein